MNQRMRCGWAVAVVGVIVGCDTPAEVLTSSAELQRSDGSWMQWCPHTDAEADMLEFFKAAKLGSACKNAQEACAVNADGFAPGCSWDWRGCIDGQVQAVTSYTIGCPVTTAQPPNGPWTSCVEALANGESGQACNFTGACTREAEDPCCIEVGLCPATGMDSYPLQRSRICAPGCNALVADVTQSPISTCQEAVAAAGKFGLPCEPGLVCFSNGPFEIDDPTGATLDSSLIRWSSVHWCANGLLMHSTSALATALW